MKKFLSFMAIIGLANFAFAQPAAPTLNTPADGSTADSVNITLIWSPVSGAIGYEAQISTDSNFSSPTNLTVLGTGALNSELLFGQKYYWRVRSKGTGGTVSAYSSIRSFTTFIDEFTGLAPSGGERNPRLSIRWDSVPGVSSYQWQRDTSMSFVNAQSGVVTTRQAVQDNMVFGETYYWRVRGIHSKDTSDWSATTNFDIINQIDLTAEATFPNNGATNRDPEGELRCERVPGVLEYRFVVARDSMYDPSSPGFNAYSVPSTVSGNIKVITSRLSFGTEYFWRVQAVNNAGTSEWTNSYSFTVKEKVTLTSPADEATGVSNLGAFLKWEDIRGAEQYWVEIDDNDAFTSPDQYQVSDTNAQLVVLSTWDTPYFWRVRASHAKDTSEWSNTWSFEVSPVGINTVEKEQSFDVYPNPASNEVQIQLSDFENEEVSLRVFNILGKPVVSRNLGIVGANGQYNLDISSLNGGVYLIMIETDSGTKTKRITVE